LPFSAPLRLGGEIDCLSVTLTFMAKFKPVKGKKPRAAGPPPGGLACVVLVILAMVLVMVFLYFAMRNPG